MAVTGRAVAVLVTSGGVGLVLAHSTHAAISAVVGSAGATGPAALDQQVAGALALLTSGAALVAWTGWCLTLVRASAHSPPRSAPSRWLRTAAAVLGVSTATLTGAGPALGHPQGDGIDPPPRSAAELDLDGLPLPDLPVSGATRARPGAERAPAHVVAAGDSLWSIAAGRLPADGSKAAVDRLWPRWYATNRAVIGPDPNLILPGQRLFPPPARRADR